MKTPTCHGWMRLATALETTYTDPTLHFQCKKCGNITIRKITR